MKKIYLILTAVVLLVTAGCKKDYLETKPSNAVPVEQLFGQLSSVYAALNGSVKEQFAFSVGSADGPHDAFGQKAYDLANELMGNDMVVHSQGYGWFNRDYNYTEFLNGNQGRQCDMSWYLYYDLIRQSNTILTYVDDVQGATQADKDAIKGEALGIRAYCYFYLINYFQQTFKGHETSPGVPVRVDLSILDIGRGTVQEVYDQMISDLTTAETLLNGKPRVDKSHIDVSVVRGFRARIALIQEDWATAATYAHNARQGYTLMVGSEYTAMDAFSSINNSEWMWGSIIPEAEATIYASFFSHMDINTGGYAALGGQKKITKALYDQIQVGDIRKNCWTAPGTGSGANVDYNQVKFQVPNPGSWAADYVYMRSAEMYLIEAEALAHQGQDATAQSVLEELIVSRYPTYDATTFTGQALINEILLQRRIELWGEGFALMDIKRLNQGLNRPTGPGNHGAPNYDPGIYTTGQADPRFLMRIPQREIDYNSAMTANDQNP